MKRTSMALATSDRPQLKYASAMDTAAISAVALRGLRGRLATPSSSAFTGAVRASR